MAIWLINLESDVMLGIFAPSRKLSIFTIILYWIINILTFLVQEPYLIDSIFCFQTLGSVVAFYLIIGIPQYLIYKERIDKKIVQVSQQPSPSPQNSPQTDKESANRQLLTAKAQAKPQQVTDYPTQPISPILKIQPIHAEQQQHQSDQPEQIGQTVEPLLKEEPDQIDQMKKDEKKKELKREPTPLEIKRSYFTWLFSFATFFIIHSLLFIHQMTSQIIVKSAISMHLILLTELFSSVLANFYVFIAVGNLLINLHTQDVFEKYCQIEQFNKTYTNFSTNFAEIYLVSFNLALIMSSIVGILFLNDLASQVLFYFYLSIFGIVFLLRLYYKIKTNEY